MAHSALFKNMKLETPKLWQSQVSVVEPFIHSADGQLKIDGRLKYIWVFQKAVEGEILIVQANHFSKSTKISMLFKPHAHLLIQNYPQMPTTSSLTQNQRGVNLGIRFEDAYICFYFSTC